MTLMPFIIAIMGIIMPIIILAIVFYSEQRSEQRFHETLHKLMDSDNELTEEVIAGIPGYKKVSPRDDMRNGTIAVGVGIGLFLFGWLSLGSTVMGAGLLVACIGAALLYLGNKNQSKDVQH